MENAKILNYIFAYSFVSEYSKHFFFRTPLEDPVKNLGTGI